MALLKVGRAAELLGVGPDTVRRWVDSGRLAATARQGTGHRLIQSASLAHLAQELAAEQASRPRGWESARNRLEGLVTRVVRDHVMAQVEIQSGPHRLVALISREAADELRLEPGVIAVAAVKATSVVVELPGPPDPAA
ncbi:MAG: molybdopterin-binding protein [Candidatus Dormibacteria bacterium]